MKQITGGITAAKGFQASGTYCGIKKVYLQPIIRTCVLRQDKT